ncbi:glutaredoxin-1-like [Ptychodera flava]|uniref:glutaredoxin-1-like n=1 Tax=Ptychodera flava TaxID=63121 RepID=UPI00396A36DD
MTCSFVLQFAKFAPYSAFSRTGLCLASFLTRTTVSFDRFSARPKPPSTCYLQAVHYCNLIDMSKGKAFADAKIAGSKVVVFSKSYCPYCKMAKTALSKHEINSLDIIEIEDRDDCEEIQDYMSKLTGGRSVPRVFINGKFIGGGSETTQFEREGKLEVMLKDAGAL